MREKFVKFVRRIWSFLWILLTAAVLIVLVDVSVDKLNHRIPDVAGYSIFRVSTGSMEPSIPTGMYILVKKVDPETIQTGDIITFYSEDPSIYNYPNTHRVVSRWMEVSGEMMFETRGDANYINDKLLVPESRIIGQVLLNLTELTDFVEFFMTRSMLILLLSMQFLCVVMAIYFNKLKKTSKAESRRAQEELVEKLTQQEVERLIREAQEKEQSEKNSSQEEAPEQPEQEKEDRQEEKA